MIGRINWDQDVRSLEDALIKVFNPLMPTHVMRGGQTEEIARAKNQVAQAEQQLDQVEVEEDKPKPEELPPEATTGSEIQGFKGNEQPGMPTEQPGTEATASPTAPPAISKTFFYDNFGIKGGDLLNLLEKAGEEDVLPQVIDLLRNEQQAILKDFSWWDDEDWDILRLQDNDFNLLVMFPERLELPFRQTIVAIKKTNDIDELDKIWKTWHNRLNAENRLSRRERNILGESYNTIRKHGDMNSQTISSYGINATPKEIASLIKSYGFLYDLKVVGSGAKGDDRALYYGTTKPPIFLKAIDSFIGNLWEVGGELNMTPTGSVRLFLPFNTKRAEDYTVVLKAELDVQGIVWEGRQFVFDGEYAVKKAAEIALPFLTEKKNEASLLIATLDGNENAGRILAYRNAIPQIQVDMLKEWNVSEDDLYEWEEVIVND